MARKLIRAGVETALITLAGEGSLVVSGVNTSCVYAPQGRGSGWLRCRGNLLSRLYLWIFTGLAPGTIRSFRHGSRLTKSDSARVGNVPVEEILAFAEQIGVEDLSYQRLI